MYAHFTTLIIISGMFLNPQLYSTLWSTLSSLSPSPTHSHLQSAISTLRPSLTSLPHIENLHTYPTQSLSQLNGKPVCLRMMIQDIFQTQYYSAAILKSPTLSTQQQLQSNLVLNKYWVNLKSMEEVEDNCQHVILDREVYRAVVPKGQMEWVTQVNGGGDVQDVILRCFNHQGFKLGQVVNVVGVLEFNKEAHVQELAEGDERDYNWYYPINRTPRVNVLGTLTEEQILVHNLDYKTRYLREEIDFLSTREKLLGLFTRFCTPRYAQFLLYSLINNSQRMNLYISGENLQPLLKHLLPYLIRADIRFPFKQPLFPKKYQVIKDSQLQLSSQQTYVILDFTDIGEVKLQGQEIVTLQMLKKFAEESELVYQWQMGESIFPRNSSGIIAKASSIIQPTFNLKNQLINLNKIPDFEQYKGFVEELRAYIIQVRKRSESVFLSSDSEKEMIEKDFVEERQETEGKLTPEEFSQRLLVSRLDAASLGQGELSYKVYQRIKEMMR